MRFQLLKKSALLYVCKIQTIIIIIIISKIFNDKIKICLCTLAKNENKYIVEFIEHYKNYGIDKIFLYDNNDINGENFDFLSNYTKTNLLQIFNYRGILHPQLKIYEECYYNNYKNYKWFLFFDVDEYIHLENNLNLHDFLFNPKFMKCPSVYLNFNTHTDNEMKYYINRSLFERFPKVIQKKNSCIGKSILRGNIENIHMQSCHILDGKLKRCNGFGDIITLHFLSCKVPDYKYNYIDHFQFKSTDEFVQKVKKGDGRHINSEKIKYRKIWEYFSFNKITLYKIKYISDNLGLNESYIRNQLYLFASKFIW